MLEKNLHTNLLELMNLESPEFPSQEHMVLVINTSLSFNGSLMMKIKIFIAEYLIKYMLQTSIDV